MAPSAPPLSPATLRALLDRIIPEDEFPGAVTAGVEHYVLRQLAPEGDCAAEAPSILLGLAQLDAETRARGHGDSFTALDPAKQDALLHDLENGRTSTAWPGPVTASVFFLRMVELAQEGYYADPANGGNRDAVSWRMVGYNPRTPPSPVGDGSPS